jgi:ABC-type nitrate/sulfonate/bicarbonate transport system ATPase subunit
LEEALYLSDRILILRQGRMHDEVSVAFGRPRDEAIKFSSEFIRLKKELYEAINNDSVAANSERSWRDG